MLEAKNMQEIYANVMPHFHRLVQIPLPIMELCRPNVLVMERLEGVPLVQGVRAQYKRYAEAHGTTLEAMEEEQKEKVRNAAC